LCRQPAIRIDHVSHTWPLLLADLGNRRVATAIWRTDTSGCPRTSTFHKANWDSAIVSPANCLKPPPCAPEDSSLCRRSFVGLWRSLYRDDCRSRLMA